MIKENHLEIKDYSKIKIIDLVNNKCIWVIKDSASKWLYSSCERFSSK